jgi:hypothetical protein
MQNLTLCIQVAGHAAVSCQITCNMFSLTVSFSDVCLFMMRSAETSSTAGHRSRALSTKHHWRWVFTHFLSWVLIYSTLFWARICFLSHSLHLSCMMFVDLSLLHKHKVCCLISWASNTWSLRERKGVLQLVQQQCVDSVNSKAVSRKL